MNEFDEMSAEEIKKYLEKGKCSTEKVQDIYNHEMNGEMRADVLEVIRGYLPAISKSKPIEAKKKK